MPHESVPVSFLGATGVAFVKRPVHGLLPPAAMFPLEPSAAALARIGVPQVAVFGSQSSWYITARLRDQAQFIRYFRQIHLGIAPIPFPPFQELSADGAGSLTAE